MGEKLFDLKCLVINFFFILKVFKKFVMKRIVRSCIYFYIIYLIMLNGVMFYYI